MSAYIDIDAAILLEVVANAYNDLRNKRMAEIERMIKERLNKKWFWTSIPRYKSRAQAIKSLAVSYSYRCLTRCVPDDEERMNDLQMLCKIALDADIKTIKVGSREMSILYTYFCSAPIKLS